MKLINAKTLFGIELIKPLLDGSKFEQDEMADRLKELITDYPENLFIVLSIDNEASDESKMLKGFVIAFATGDRVDISQLSCKDERQKDLLFHRVVLWAESIGVENITMKIRIGDELFSDKWDFSTIFTVKTYAIKDATSVNKQLLRLGEELEPLPGEDKEDKKNGKTERPIRVST